MPGGHHENGRGEHRFDKIRRQGWAVARQAGQENWIRRSVAKSARSRDFPPFHLGQAAPDSERLPNSYRVFGTRLAHRADLADCLGPLFASFTFVFSFKGRGGEEEMGVIAPAQSFQLPIVRQPHRCSLPDLGWSEGNDGCQDPPGKLWKEQGQFSRPSSTSRRHPLTAMTTISAPLRIPDSR